MTCIGMSWVVVFLFGSLANVLPRGSAPWNRESDWVKNPEMPDS